MTDYSSWSNFDEKGELADADARFAVDDLRDLNIKANRAQTKELQNAAHDAQKEAEAMRARMQVEALKASTTSNESGATRRRRKKAQDKPITSENRSDKDPTENSTGSAASVATPVSTQTLVDHAASEGHFKSDDKKDVNCPITAPSSTDGGLDSSSGAPQEPSKLHIITTLVRLMNDCSSAFNEILSRSDAFSRSTSSSTLALSSHESNAGASGAILSTGLTLLSDLESFEACELRRAGEAETVAVTTGLVTEVRSSSKVLVQLVECTKRLGLQLRSSLSIIALKTGFFALSTDLSRSWIISQPEGLSVEGSAGSSAARADDPTSSGLAVMWMTRALALAAMGSPYMSNLHAIKAQTYLPSYPNISKILAVLDVAELDFFGKLQSQPLHVLVLEQVQVWLHQYSESIMSPLDPHNVSPEALQVLLKGIGGSKRENPGGGDADEIYMPDDGSSEISGDTAASECSTSQITAKDVWDSLLAKYGSPGSAIPHLLRILHEAFYQAQLLYLEEMYFSAEIKYFAVAFLATAASSSYSARTASTGDEQGDTEQYVTAVHISCLLNAAVCRTHRRPPSKMSRPSTTHSFSTGTQQSRDLIALLGSPSELTPKLLVCCSDGHTGTDPRTALDMSIAAVCMSSPSFPLFLGGYFRAIEVHEAHKHFETALQLTEHALEQIQCNETVSKWSTGDMRQHPLFVARYSGKRLYSETFLAPLLTATMSEVAEAVQVAENTTVSAAPGEASDTTELSLQLLRVEVPGEVERLAILEQLQKIRDRLEFKMIKFPHIG